MRPTVSSMFSFPQQPWILLPSILTYNNRPGFYFDYRNMLDASTAPFLSIIAIIVINLFPIWALGEFHRRLVLRKSWTWWNEMIICRSYTQKFQKKNITYNLNCCNKYSETTTKTHDRCNSKWNCTLYCYLMACQ